ncbi:hypothetical protein [Arabiibacter massiliensis]|uniref:hypothetical protein n=1 Tax=Arabiibacter massiliensis TaxID=1870985 RepID=UPI0009B9C270|nr:hypothetical protein [Arabiibacter massiliensis]
MERRRGKLGTFAHLARYDLARGFSSNGTRLVVAFVCVIALAAMFLSALDAAAGYARAMGADDSSGGFGFVDVLAYFFAGSDYYRAGGKVPFALPIGWLIQQILIAVLVGSYAVHDLGGQAPQVLVRIGGRWAWWLSKCLWTAATVLAFYAAEAFVALAAAAALGGLGAMGDVESVAVLGFSLSGLDGARLALLLVLPAALSLALSLAQVALSLVAGPFMAFVAVVAFLATSVYFGSPLLIGDCSMMARSAFVQQGGVDAAAALAACAGVGSVAVILGGLAFSRRDLADRKD